MPEEAPAARERPREGAEAPRQKPSGQMFSRSGVLVLMVVVVLEAAILSASYFLIFKRPKPPALPGAETGVAAAGAKVVTSALADLIINVPFDPTAREQKYLYVEISIELSPSLGLDAPVITKEISDELKPIFADQINSILRHKEYLDLQNPDNELRLKQEIKTALNQIYLDRKGRKDVIDKVLFTRWEMR